MHYALSYGLGSLVSLGPRPAGRWVPRCGLPPGCAPFRLARSLVSSQMARALERQKASSLIPISSARLYSRAHG